MTGRISLGLNLAVATVLAWTLLGPMPGVTATIGYLNVAAPAFEPLAYSVHNRNGATVCANYQTPAAPDETGDGENRGDLDNGKGSYLAAVQLPQGVRVTRLNLFYNDFADTDVHVYLLRKKIAHNLEPASSGYGVMGHAASAGAVLNTMRRASDATIKAGTINNASYYYFLEMVHCMGPEPYAAQLVFQR